MFTLLDGDVLWPEFANEVASFDERIFASELAGFAIVEYEHVHPLEQRKEVVLGDVDPEIHRVGDDEPGPGHLVEDMTLQARGNIGKQDIFGVIISRRQRGCEMFKYIELDAAGRARVEVGVVFPGPAKGFAGGDLQPAKVDLAAAEKFHVRFREILADDAHEVDAGEEARADGGIGSRAAEQIGVFGEGCFDGIKTNGTYN